MLEQQLRDSLQNIVLGFSDSIKLRSESLQFNTLPQDQLFDYWSSESDFLAAYYSETLTAVFDMVFDNRAIFNSQCDDITGFIDFCIAFVSEYNEQLKVVSSRFLDSLKASYQARFEVDYPGCFTPFSVYAPFDLEARELILGGSIDDDGAIVLMSCKPFVLRLFDGVVSYVTPYLSVGSSSLGLSVLPGR